MKILILTFVIIISLVSISKAETVRVVYKPDGTVAIIHQVKKGTPQVIFNETIADSPELQGLPYEDMDITELPQTREDRNYWIKKQSGGIKIDTGKKNADKQAKKDKKDKIKQKLKLTDKELADLKEVLK